MFAAVFAKLPKPLQSFVKFAYNLVYFKLVDYFISVFVELWEKSKDNTDNGNHYKIFAFGAVILALAFAFLRLRKMDSSHDYRLNSPYRPTLLSNLMKSSLGGTGRSFKVQNNDTPEGSPTQIPNLRGISARKFNEQSEKHGDQTNNISPGRIPDVVDGQGNKTPRKATPFCRSCSKQSPGSGNSPNALRNRAGAARPKKPVSVSALKGKITPRKKSTSPETVKKSKSLKGKADKYSEGNDTLNNLSPCKNIKQEGNFLLPPTPKPRLSILKNDSLRIPTPKPRTDFISEAEPSTPTRIGVVKPVTIDECFKSEEIIAFVPLSPQQNEEPDESSFPSMLLTLGLTIFVFFLLVTAMMIPVCFKIQEFVFQHSKIVPVVTNEGMNHTSDLDSKLSYNESVHNKIEFADNLKQCPPISLPGESSSQGRIKSPVLPKIQSTGQPLKNKTLSSKTPAVSKPTPNGKVKNVKNTHTSKNSNGSNKPPSQANTKKPSTSKPMVKGKKASGVKANVIKDSHQQGRNKQGQKSSKNKDKKHRHT